jgi:DNA polymerase I-like protein with 3'-5' exonuclease and polymerase domains/uracil-DNA glycosylase
VGFYSLPAKNVNKNETKGLSVELLTKLGCRACPLDRVKGNKNPHLAPQGHDDPLIYMLDGPPTTRDDAAGKNFAGGVDRIIKHMLPRWVGDRVRWSSITRTASREIDGKVEKKVVDARQYRKGDADNPNEYVPPRPPTMIELVCCRPSVEEDIARSKPDAIFAFGGEAVKWLSSIPMIEKWRGRRFPVTIKGHSCWVYPIMHPYHARSKRKWDKRECEEELQLERDITNACAELKKGLPFAKVYDPKGIADDVELIDGSEPGDFDKALDFIGECWEVPEVGFDYETDRIRPYAKGSRILSVAMSHTKRTAAIALDHPQAKWTDEQLDDIFDALKDFLVRATTRKFVHGLSFELEWSGVILGRSTIRGAGEWHDSVSQAYVLDERSKMGKPDALSLDFLCMQYFGINLKIISNLDRKKLAEEPVRDVLRYNGLDAKFHRLLAKQQLRRIEQEGLMDVYIHHNERVPAAVLTQIKGVPISPKVNTSFYKRFKREETEAYDRVMAMPVVAEFKSRRKIEFEPSNNNHVLYVMKEILGKKMVSEKTGRASTDKKVLEKIKHAFPRAIEAYRGASKNLVTYIVPARRGSPHLYDDDKMHPLLQTCSTDTGRTSSEDPNVQNWPKRKLKIVREQVRGDETEVVVSFDYGQIQARNIAMESLDKVFIKSFWDREDIHGEWVRNIDRECPGWHLGGAKLKNEKEFDDARGIVKNSFVFPSFFGASPNSISVSLGLGDKRNKAKLWEMQESLFERFSGIKKWQDGMKAFYLEHGYVTGLSGYRRRAPISPNQLINAPIQADEAIIVLDAMIRLSKLGWVFQANMEIHDDLTFVWKKKNVERYAETVIGEMLACPFEWTHAVPLAVEMAVGPSWGQQKKVETYFTDKWKGHDPSLGSWADGEGWAGMAKYAA